MFHPPVPLSWKPHRGRYTQNPSRAEALQLTKITYKYALALDWTGILEGELGKARDIQGETGGFTEFVPLSLIHSEAPMYAKQLVPGVRPGATGAEVVRMHALARVMLGALIPNIQASWVKEGPKLAQLLLDAGANDLGGTLINESISTSAGASYGQLVGPGEDRSHRAPEPFREADLHRFGEAPILGRPWIPEPVCRK